MTDEPLTPGLYLVSTPIGNLEDITLRALRVLRSVDRIACEDTRQTRKLLDRYGITTPTVSSHEHNEGARSHQLIEELQAGGRIAVVSDAGTPGISDPGMVLAGAAIAAGIPVYPDSRAQRLACCSRCLRSRHRTVLLLRLSSLEGRRAPHRAGEPGRIAAGNNHGRLL